jgi:REP element-mobilizing transposase RayT
VQTTKNNKNSLKDVKRDISYINKSKNHVYYKKHRIQAKYRRKVLVGLVEVRLVEVLKTIAENHGYNLLACRVHVGDYVHVFVSAKPSARIFDVVYVL